MFRSGPLSGGARQHRSSPFGEQKTRAWTPFGPINLQSSRNSTKTNRAKSRNPRYPFPLFLSFSSLLLPFSLLSSFPSRCQVYPSIINERLLRKRGSYVAYATSRPRNKFAWFRWVALDRVNGEGKETEEENLADFSPREREKGALFRDAIINRYDRLNRNGIRAIACAGSIISRTDLQGARGSFNARIGVSIIAISFIRLFFLLPAALPARLARTRPSTITGSGLETRGRRAITLGTLGNPIVGVDPFRIPFTAD